MDVYSSTLADFAVLCTPSNDDITANCGKKMPMMN
jgi:hypothetical protein